MSVDIRTKVSGAISNKVLVILENNNVCNQSSVLNKITKNDGIWKIKRLNFENQCWKSLRRLGEWVIRLK